MVCKIHVWVAAWCFLLCLLKGSRLSIIRSTGLVSPQLVVNLVTLMFMTASSAACHHLQFDRFVTCCIQKSPHLQWGCGMYRCSQEHLTVDCFLSHLRHVCAKARIRAESRGHRNWCAVILPAASLTNECPHFQVHSVKSPLRSSAPYTSLFIALAACLRTRWAWPSALDVESGSTGNARRSLVLFFVKVHHGIVMHACNCMKVTIKVCCTVFTS